MSEDKIAWLLEEFDLQNQVFRASLLKRQELIAAMTKFVVVWNIEIQVCKADLLKNMVLDYTNPDFGAV